MIRLITGIPGAGKTLLAVEIIRDVMLSDTPRVIYTNIKGLDHTALRTFDLVDPTAWFDLPDGSMVIIDECQQYFPPRPNGSKVPESVSRFETHRHQGLDIVLISQHPRLLDQNIRRLVEHHQHCYRPFGLKQRTVMEWNVCNDDPTPKQSESSAELVKKKFDTSLYQYYQSATVHTHKTRYPWKKIILFAASIVVFIGCVTAFILGKMPDSDSQEDLADATAITTSDPAPFISSPSPLEDIAPSSSGDLLYRGNIASSSGIVVWLEDPITGQYFDLSDFDGYSKEPGHRVKFLQNRAAGEASFLVSSSELYSLLP